MLLLIVLLIGYLIPAVVLIFCENVQGLSKSRTMEKGQVDLRVWNGARVAALAVGVFHLFSFMACFELKTATMYLLWAERLFLFLVWIWKDISFQIKNKCYSFDYNDIFYSSNPLENGLYVLNQNVPNYNINTKRFKSNDTSQTSLWHCRFGLHKWEIDSEAP